MNEGNERAKKQTLQIRMSLNVQTLSEDSDLFQKTS